MKQLGKGDVLFILTLVVITIILVLHYVGQLSEWGLL